ncbi:MAG: polysaccharide lyase [Deltaproteobacteria bacterium]
MAITIYALAIVSVSLLSACADISTSKYEGPLRSFETSFESISDFKDFYIVPPGDYDSSHEFSSEKVVDGVFAHKAWIVAARASDNDGIDYSPHRAYPTIQFQKTTEGIYRTPCLISLWVNLDINLIDRTKGSIDDWFSFVTLTPDSSDNWSRTVIVNITPDGYIRLAHVPRQGEQEYLYQVDSVVDPPGNLKFAYRDWVRLDIYIDFSAAGGYAKLWQNGVLVSHAMVEGGEGGLAQAHFGLYASAAIPSGTIYNDKLRIKEVLDETEANALVNSSW